MAFLKSVIFLRFPSEGTQAFGKPKGFYYLRSLESHKNYAYREARGFRKDSTLCTPPYLPRYYYIFNLLLISHTLLLELMVCGLVATVTRVF